MTNSPAAAPSLKLGSVGLIVALACAAAFALGRFSAPGAELAVQNGPAPMQVPLDAPRPGADPALPPGHPPIGAGATAAPAATDPSTGLAMEAHNDGALKWTKPASWQELPNTSSMRIATYGAPKVGGDQEAPQLTVMQAGGSLDANIERWAGQFGEQGHKELKRESKQIAGLPVTIVTTHGSYDGGMAMGGAAPAPASEAALLAAIVELGEMPYFFKMTGPRKSVEAARADFDALLASLQKAQ